MSGSEKISSEVPHKRKKKRKDKPTLEERHSVLVPDSPKTQRKKAKREYEKLQVKYEPVNLGEDNNIIHKKKKKKRKRSENSTRSLDSVEDGPNSESRRIQLQHTDFSLGCTNPVLKSELLLECKSSKVKHKKKKVKDGQPIVHLSDPSTPSRKKKRKKHKENMVNRELLISTPVIDLHNSDNDNIESHSVSGDENQLKENESEEGFQPDIQKKQHKKLKKNKDKLPKVKGDGVDSSIASSFRARRRKKKEVIETNPEIDLEECASSYDYIKMVIDAEYEKQRLKDEYRQMLRDLVIQPPIDVPQSHLIETRMSSHPTKAQRKQFEDLALDMKTTHYSSEEDETIMKNWCDFCKTHNLSTDPTPFLNFQTEKDTKTMGSILPRQERINFVRCLGDNLEDRYLFSVYRRFKSLYTDTVKKGIFSEVEDKIIVTFMKNSEEANNFSKLAIVLNRDRHSILMRYKLLSENR